MADPCRLQTPCMPFDAALEGFKIAIGKDADILRRMANEPLRDSAAKSQKWLFLMSQRLEQYLQVMKPFLNDVEWDEGAPALGDTDILNLFETDDTEEK